MAILAIIRRNLLVGTSGLAVEEATDSSTRTTTKSRDRRVLLEHAIVADELVAQKKGCPVNRLRRAEDEVGR